MLSQFSRLASSSKFGRDILLKFLENLGIGFERLKEHLKEQIIKSCEDRPVEIWFMRLILVQLFVINKSRSDGRPFDGKCEGKRLADDSRNVSSILENLHTLHVLILHCEQAF